MSRCSYMWTMKLCSCLNLHGHHCLRMCSEQSVLYMDYGINQDKQNLFIVPLKVNEAFALHYTKYTCSVQVYIYTNHSTHWINRHVSLNHQLTTPHRDYIHSKNDNVRGLDVYLQTQPLFICHANSPCPYKTGPKEQLSSRLSNICSHWGYIQIQTSSLLSWILPNTWQRMNNYSEIYRWLSVLVLVQVSLLSRFSHT